MVVRARAATAALGLLAAAACGNPETIVDYPYYDSVRSLLRNADLVVIATPGKGRYVAATDEGGLDHRVSPLTVHATVVGRLPQGSAVELSEIDDNVRDERLLKPGRKYLLVLATVPGQRAGLVQMMSPEQGQYPLNEAGQPRQLKGNPVVLDLGSVPAQFTAAHASGS